MIQQPLALATLLLASAIFARHPLHGPIPW